MRKQSSILHGRIPLLKRVPKIRFTTVMSGAGYGNLVYLNHSITRNVNCPKLRAF